MKLLTFICSGIFLSGIVNLNAQWVQTNGHYVVDSRHKSFMKNGISINNGARWTATGAANIHTHTLAISSHGAVSTNLFTKNDSSDNILSTNNRVDGTAVNNRLQNYQSTSSQWQQFTNIGEIRSIAIHGSEIWASTEGGVVRYDTATKQKTVYTMLNGLPGNYITAISIAPNGDPVCVVEIVYDHALYEFNGSTWIKKISISPVYGNMIHDKSGNLWIADLETSGQVYTNLGVLQQLPLTGYSECVAIDKLDRPWFGMDNKGVYFKNDTGWIHYDTINSGIASNTIGSITVDIQNRVWFSHPETYNPQDTSAERNFNV